MQLSIVVPMYNASKYILRLLDSIFTQDSNNVDFELIIVDDKSTDESVVLVEEYIKKNKIINLKLIKSHTNGGTAAARNLGLNQVTGSWVQFVDSDDWLDPNYFQSIFPYLDNQAQCLIYGTRSHFQQSIREVEPKLVIDKRKVGFKNVIDNKVYKVELIQNFETEYKFEDVIWLTEVMNNTEIECLIIDRLYYNTNRINQDSKMANIDQDEWKKMALEIINRSKSYDDLTRSFVLEVFVGTTFRNIFKLSNRVHVCLKNLMTNYKFLPFVTKNGIRNNEHVKIIHK